ncbi:MAG TPA: hypothetical protein VFU73_14740, partial [Actinocrinis sp.]|nr:hypothetical protein [Actinocrinis sp.]
AAARRDPGAPRPAGRLSPVGRGDRRAAPRAGYQQWADYLERWGENKPCDASTLGALDLEDFLPDTWERLNRRFTAAVSRRLELWGRDLNRAMSSAADEFSFGRTLQQGRAGAHAIRALAVDPRLPEPLRGQLAGQVDKALEQTQKNLKRDVERQRDRGDSARLVERRLRTLADNPLTAVTTQSLARESATEAKGRRRSAADAPPLGTGTPHAWNGSAPGDPPSRRIIRP